MTKCDTINSDTSSDKKIDQTEATILCHSNDNAYEANIAIQANHSHFGNNTPNGPCSLDFMIKSVTFSTAVDDKNMPTNAQSTSGTKLTQTSTLPACVSVTTVTQHEAITGLGASMGLLMVMLVGMAVGWIWTCWVMMNRGRVIRNLQQATER